MGTNRRFRKLYTLVIFLGVGVLSSNNILLFKTEISYKSCSAYIVIRSMKQLVKILDILWVIGIGIFSYVTFIENRFSSSLQKIQDVDNLLKVNQTVHRKAMIYSILQSGLSMIYCVSLTIFLWILVIESKKPCY